MSAIVVMVGLLILLLSISIFISPAKLKRLLRIFMERRWWHFASAIRIVIGILFLVAAPDTHAPSVVRALGIMFILAGAAIPIMGVARIERLVHWWLARSESTFRLWAIAAAGFGMLIMWSGQ
jgi:hypothetical protein